MPWSEARRGSNQDLDGGVGRPSGALYVSTSRPDYLPVTAHHTNSVASVSRVRHEAGEALGAIGTATCMKELQQYVRDPCLEVSQNHLDMQLLKHISNFSGFCLEGPTMPKYRIRLHHSPYTLP